MRLPLILDFGFWISASRTTRRATHTLRSADAHRFPGVGAGACMFLAASSFTANAGGVSVKREAAPSSRWQAFVRVKPVYPTGQLKLWGSDDGKEWRYLCSSQPFLQAKMSEGKDYPDYLFALEYLPAHVRLGVTGAHLGRIRVDSVEAFVGTKLRPFLSVKGVGEVLDPENARVADGKPAIIVHRGQPDIVDGLAFGCTPSPKPPLRRAATVKFGTYTSPRDASDRIADAIAWWDFTVFQEGATLQECVRKVKQRNPKHRVVLRLVWPNACLLLYAYDRLSRDALRAQVVDLPLSGIVDLVDTVTLNEEEPGNMMRGIAFSPIPPEAVYLYRHEFEKETGKPFTWPSDAVNDWLGQKLAFVLNDLYSYIKEKYPKLKVYQWVELRGYGNISGYPEYVRGENLKMDGYVLEWNATTWESLVDTPFGKASVPFSYFPNYLRNVCERKGLRPDQLLGQVWAYDPADPTALAQIEAERQEGVSHIYFFWPNAGLPQVPDTFGPGNAPDRQFALGIWEKFRPLVEAERRAGRSRGAKP